MPSAGVEVNQIKSARLRDSSIREDKLSWSHLLRRRFGDRNVRLRTTPSDYLQRPVPILDHRRPVLHPVAVVYVQNVSDQSMVRPMNVSADDAVSLVVARGGQHRAIAEVGEKLDCLAGRITEIVGKRTAFVVSRFRRRLYQS